MRIGKLLMTSLLVTFTACVDFDDATSYVGVEVQVLCPEGHEGLDLGGLSVSLSGQATQRQAQTDADGVARFDSIVPDSYDLAVTWSVGNLTISGSANNVLISHDQRLDMPTLAAHGQDIVIGKIFYAGTKDNNNRNYMAGKYLELFNQSDNEIDVAGLYIGLTEGESTQAYTLENLHTDYQDSVVLLKQVFRIPVDQPHKVAPGGTILIANSAIDHRQNNNDKEHDLSDADFEAKDTSGKTVNNPNTPALEIIFLWNQLLSYMNLVQSGPCGVVIFRTEEDPTNWARTYAYGKQTGSQWLLCPVRCIIDGVDCLRNKATGVDIGTKRLYPSIDAGYTNIEAISGWTGETVCRKVDKTVEGHKLTDTNNSREDMTIMTDINPREYEW